MPGGERVVRWVKKKRKKKCVGVINKSNGKDDDDTMRLVKVVAVIRGRCAHF